MNKYLLVFKLLFLLTYFGIVQLFCSRMVLAFDQSYVQQAEERNLIVAFEINAQIFILFDLLEADPAAAKQVKDQIVVDFDQLNTAEKYLLLIAQAEIANNEYAFKQAMALLKQAQGLMKNISKSQLTRPMFLKLYLTLSQSYHGLKQDDLAYQKKSTYLKAYHEYSAVKREEIIARLTLKYKISYKNKKNQLLANENFLKSIKLKEKQRVKDNQQQNITLIAILVVLFILLFIRELMLKKKLLFFSKIDVLTKIYNHRTFLKRGNHLFNSRESSPLSLFVVDINNLKQINDKYGYEIGDKVLTEVALLGKESMRSRDTFARVGGEEFVALLPDTSITEAKAIAEHVKDKISTHLFANNVKQNVTVSIGVASTEHINCSFDALFHAGELAMYQA